MARLFNTGKSRGALHSVSMKIRLMINGKARLLAFLLNKKAALIGKRWLAFTMIVAAGCWCWACGYVAWESVGGTSPTLRISKIKTPRTSKISYDSLENARMSLSLERIKKAGHYLDSLQKKDNNRYRRITKQRPGLRDSIAMVEAWYSKNQPNK